MVTRTRRTHVFADSGQRTWDGKPICTCGWPKGHRSHATPEVPADAIELDARQMGEGNSDDEA